jgi:hypothetical protein
MKLLRMTMRAALRALRRNKMRSALTMLGIIIGVAAVIATVSIGLGADAAVQDQIRSLGTDLLMVVPGATTASGVRSGWGGVSTLTVGDARAIERDAAAVKDVTYFKRQVVQVVAGEKNWSTAVQGAPPSFFTVREWPVVLGSAYGERDEEGPRASRCSARRWSSSSSAPDTIRSARRCGSRTCPSASLACSRRRGRRCGGRTRTTSSSFRSPPPSAASSVRNSSARSTTSWSPRSRAPR